MYAKAGQPDSARTVLRSLADLSHHEYVTPYGVATIHAALGDRERAFDWLEKAYRERGEDLLLLKIDPRLDALRSDPRFDALLRRLGFPTRPAT